MAGWRRSTELLRPLASHVAKKATGKRDVAVATLSAAAKAHPKDALPPAELVPRLAPARGDYPAARQLVRAVLRSIRASRWPCGSAPKFDLAAGEAWSSRRGLSRVGQAVQRRSM